MKEERNACEIMVEAVVAFHPESPLKYLLELGATHDGDVRVEDLGPLGECYSNAARAVMDRPSWTYVEGYACAPTVAIPMPHAWAIDADGVLVETTWDKPGAHYFGLAFERRALFEHLASVGWYGVFENLWRCGKDWDAAMGQLLGA